MKWWNHILIAGSTAAVVNPAIVPIVVLGATAPDWIEGVLKVLGHHIEHRTTTHIMFYWFLAMVAGFFIIDIDPKYILLGFAYGGFNHVICDAVTISGVPMFPWSQNRSNLFGGKLRTGDPGEYIVAIIIVLLCFVLSYYIHADDKASDFIPFFYDWAGMYHEGTIDAYEWKMNRLKFF